MSVENPASDNDCDSYSLLLRSKHFEKKSSKECSSSSKDKAHKSKDRDNDCKHDKDRHKKSSLKDKHSSSKNEEKNSSEKYGKVKSEPGSPDSYKEDVWYDLQIDETRIKSEIKEEECEDGYVEVSATVSTCDHSASQCKDEPLSDMSHEEDGDIDDCPLIAHKTKKQAGDESPDAPLLQKKKPIKKIKEEQSYDNGEEEEIPRKKKVVTEKRTSIKQEQDDGASCTERNKKDDSDQRTSRNASIESKRRKIVHSEGRQMIDKLYRFLKEEYAFMAAHNNDNCDLSPLSNIRQRTADATGVSVATVTRILNEELHSPSSSSRCASPTKKRLKRDDKVDVDNVTADVIRTTIHNFHVMHGQIPTLSKIKAVLSEKVGFNGCLATLRKLLRKLGYRCRKTDGDRKVLQERHDVQMWRLQYLKQISEYRSQGRPIVYTDESYVLTSQVRDNTWALKREKIHESSKEEKQFLKKNSTGTRYVLVHAGTKDGFVPNSCLVYKANSTSGDYHSNMSFDNYVKWLNERLLPNLPEGAVVIVDNAAYHNVRAEKLLTSASLKRDMQKWLTDKAIRFEQGSCKVELYEIIKRNKANFITYKIDDVIRSRGFEVLRLPPCHPELNAIDNIWGAMKNHVALTNVKQNKDRTARLIEESVENIGRVTWVETCEGVVRKEREYMKFFDCDFELVINLQEDSDETDAEGDSNDSDCF